MAQIKYGADRGPTLVAQSIYEASKTQKHPLGHRLQLGDRVFRYAKAGGLLAAGKLALSGASVANHHSITVATTVAELKKITVTLGATAAIKNQYAEGYLAIIAGTGLGQIYKIKSHPAADANATLELTLYDELAVATDASDSKGDLCANPYAAVQNSTTTALQDAGVPLVAVPANYFCWLQTWGICVILTHTADTAAEGTLLSHGGTAGSVVTQAGYTASLVGISVGQARAATEHNLVDLRIKP